MGAFSRVREALTGGPRYTPAAAPYASTREQQKTARRNAREAGQAAGRRARHKAQVVKKGDAAGIPFDKKRGGRRRT
ncbi:hypothetical protein [Streptomyces sp. AGS-58]|uniref:hypothetical protein n=1 Tax=unclassified Streptomyces TaxID=2593676 RepID=UPI0035A339F6